MDTVFPKPRRVRKWFSWKQTRSNHFDTTELSDDSDFEGEDDINGLFVNPKDIDPCISANELRIFVGTWNVAGRSPVESLAEDLEEWLNLKDAADLYILGFQEIVPLKARNVIGAEDTTEATKWNTLIGKALNDKFGCPWLTPMVRPFSSDNYCYLESSESDFNRRASTSDCFETPARDWSRMNKRNIKYKLVASKKMVGVFVSVWMKKDLIRKYRVSNVKVCSVGCGIMGYLGNKGSVSVSMSIEGTSFCFVAAHLASGEKKADRGQRNRQVSEIFRRTCFPREDKNSSHPLTILEHDQIFWFGDLNYRLHLEDFTARKLIKKQEWRELRVFDQLRSEREDGGVFQGWKEGDIEFAPTYKYSASNFNRYSGGFPHRSGEKPRTPAWCDRILWYGKGVKQVSYLRSESRFSDHRPVSALFSTRVQLLKHTIHTLLSLSAAIVPIPTQSPPTLNEKKMITNQEEAKITLMSLLDKEEEEEEVEASSTVVNDSGPDQQ